MEKRFGTYLSHSWLSEDVDLNLFVWEQLAHYSCKLLVDANEGDQLAYPPGYYVNRIEELIRRCDLFISILTYRSPRTTVPSTDTGYSPYCLFEIRLAERARRPRLILYDKRIRASVRLRADHDSSLVQYLEFDRFDFEHGEGKELIKRRIHRWLTEVSEELSPQLYSGNGGAIVLLPESLPERNSLMAQVREALADTPFREPHELQDGIGSDVEILGRFAGNPLIVAEVGANPIPTIYAMAHALFLPAVRLFRGPAPQGVDDVLPWPLRGYVTGGYQEDIIWWTNPDQVYDGVQNHAKAMERVNRVLGTYEEGRDHFEKKRYADHHVFISHDLKGEQLALVQLIVAGLQRKSIDCWEYSTTNRAADDWLNNLQGELARTTHALLLLTDTYEQSKYCDMEIQFLLSRQVKFVPFFVGTRSKPLVRLNDRLHYQSLAHIAEDAARQVIDRLIAILAGRVSIV